MTIPNRGITRSVYRYDGPPVLRVDLTDVELESGWQEWHTITAQGGQAGAVIVATANNKLLVGEHWRLTTGALEIEFPRGFGELGERATDTAIRELREETGFKARRVTVLGTIFADTGILTNPIHVVHAALVESSLPPQHIRDAEFARLRWLEVSEVLEGVADGSVRDAITIAAFTLWQAAGGRS